MLPPKDTAQKMKFSIKDFFGKCDQTRSFLQIWSHLLKNSLMENFIFVQWDREFFAKGSQQEDIVNRGKLFCINNLELLAAKLRSLHLQKGSKH